MGRAPRIDIEGGWYHVMNRGIARQATFFEDADRIEFGRLLGVGHERFGVEVHAYCLMSNHYHLLLHCPDAGLSDYMHHLGSVLTRHVNDRCGRDGPLYRGRFHSIPVTTDGQLLVTARYIHRNPLDIEGVLTARQYRWSSHRTYLGCRRRPEWMQTAVVLDAFDGDRAAFDHFVADVDQPTRIVLDADTLLAVADLVLEQLDDSGVCARQGVARTVLLLVLDRLDERRCRHDLLERLAFPSDDALRVAVWRARRRASSTPWLQAVVDRVITLAA